ncbi:MAG TPA: TRAP transporter TatT component family protein [Candidatus Eisenbacteria bacterium]|nr:TRAP transporter TatT component family protein [Candidatus Eisenbacteria bacterium]
MHSILPRLSLCALLLVGTGCSLKRMAVNGVANSLSEGGDVFARDDDPELVRDALPFGLKTMESLLETVPKHRGLLLSACQGYTQYAYGFIQLEAERIEPTHYEEAQRLQGRALRLFLRARDFGVRGLEVPHKGLASRLSVRPDSVVRVLKKQDVPWIYWTAASWGSAINLGKDRPELTADIEVVKALIQRGLELDETYEEGALHEAMILMEALPPAMGGSPERAQRHFVRAVDLSRGQRSSPYVTFAQSVSVASQNRKEFRQLLEKALDIDPDKNPKRRLETLILQSKARTLLARQDELFLESDTTSAEESR